MSIFPLLVLANSNNFKQAQYLDYVALRKYIYSMSKDLLITVIIPVYNVAEYLQECLDSITSQSICMDQIQVILVNDGSTDESESICIRFRDRFPDNVIYVKQENAGVASARNKGIEFARGVLTTFLDGDDKWSSDAFSTVYNAYTSHADIAVYSCRMNFFDASVGEHQLNYKYKKDNIVDVFEHYNYPQMSSSSVFIRTDIVRKHRYAEGIKYSEDFRFMSEVLLDVGQYMVLEKPIYFYRRRQLGNSAIQSSVQDLDYYIPSIEKVYKHLFELSLRKYGYVLRYLQYCVMYDLRWRLKIPIQDTQMDSIESVCYCALVQELLKQIDEDIILDQKRIVTALKLYAIELRNGRSALLDMSVDSNGIIRYKDIPVFDFARNRIIKLYNISTSEESLQISGTATIPFYDENFTLRCIVNDAPIELPLVRTNENSKPYLHGVIRSDYSFELSVPLDSLERNCIFFDAMFCNESYVTRPIYNTGTSLDTKTGITQSDNKLIYRDLESIIIVPNSIINRLVALIRRFSQFHSKHTAKE